MRDKDGDELVVDWEFCVGWWMTTLLNTNIILGVIGLLL